MSFLVALVALVDSTPMIVDDNYNSPGTIGFIVTFVVAAIAVLLFFDMNRRIRKTRYRQEIREKLAEERSPIGLRLRLNPGERTRNRVQTNNQCSCPVAEECCHRERVEDFVKSKVASVLSRPLRSIEDCS